MIAEDYKMGQSWTNEPLLHPIHIKKMMKSDLLEESLKKGSPSPSSSFNKRQALSPFDLRYLERYQNDLRLARKDLLAVIVELDQLEHSDKSLAGQLKSALPQIRAQIKRTRSLLRFKIEDKLELYRRIKDEVHHIDKKIKRLVNYGEVEEEEMRKRIKV